MLRAIKDKIDDTVYLAMHYICEMLTSDLDCKVCACGRGILLGLLVGIGIGVLFTMLMQRV